MRCFQGHVTQYNINNPNLSLNSVFSESRPTVITHMHYPYHSINSPVNYDLLEQPQTRGSVDLIQEHCHRGYLLLTHVFVLLVCILNVVSMVGYLLEECQYLCILESCNTDTHTHSNSYYIIITVIVILTSVYVEFIEGALDSS